VQQVADSTFDVVIAGGGIYGALCAVEAERHRIEALVGHDLREHAD
jgi:glycerol-3-phosphate dehydrogenase